MNSQATSSVSHPVRPKKVLFVSHEASRTGAPIWLLHFLRWLRRETDLEFEIVLGKGGPLESEFAAVGIVHAAQAFTANPRLLQSFDLIYSNTICNSALLDALTIGNIPVITHVHELDSGFAWVGARAMAGIIRHTSHFIACAGAVADRLQAIFSIRADRISVHYSTIDGAAVARNAAAATTSGRRDYDLPEDAFVITACGTANLRKGPDLFVQAAARIKRRLGTQRPLRFLWIGSLSLTDLANHLRLDVHKLGLDEEVRFVGELPAPHGLIAQSDLFFLTSREDPFPLVMLEAAALGKPVLCFDGAGGAREFCALGGGVSVPYLDVEAMAETACELLLDPARRAETGRRGAEIVRERFTFEAVAPGLWRELRRHLDSSAAVASCPQKEASLADIYATWTLAAAPQRTYVEAHLRRDCARKQARLLVCEGQKQAAIELLMRTVGADIDLKDPLVAFESLVEIADDLAPLNAQQSAVLLGGAERFARTNPSLRVEAFRRKHAAA